MRDRVAEEVAKQEAGRASKEAAAERRIEAGKEKQAAAWRRRPSRVTVEQTSHGTSISVAPVLLRDRYWQFGPSDFFLSAASLALFSWGIAMFRGQLESALSVNQLVLGITLGAPVLIGLLRLLALWVVCKTYPPTVLAISANGDFLVYRWSAKRPLLYGHKGELDYSDHGSAPWELTRWVLKDTRHRVGLILLTPDDIQRARVGIGAATGRDVR